MSKNIITTPCPRLQDIAAPLREIHGIAGHQFCPLQGQCQGSCLLIPPLPEDQLQESRIAVWRTQTATDLPGDILNPFRRR